jgi:hypothetical protein
MLQNKFSKLGAIILFFFKQVGCSVGQIVKSSHKTEVVERHVPQGQLL